MTNVINVQDFMMKDIFEDQEDKKNNELLELLEFTKNNGVPLTDDQVKGFFLLTEMGFNDIANYALSIRPEITTSKKFFKLIDKITLADRIKGNAKLSNLIKAQVSSPSNSLPTADMQPKQMSKREIGGY